MLCGVAHVGDVYLNQGLDARDIEKIAAVFRDQAVNQQYVARP